MNISCRLTAEEKELIVAYAEENDLSMSQVVRKALKEFFKAQEAEEKE